MNRAELCQQRLGEWLDGLEMPALGHPHRRLEEACLAMLRNFFVLLLVRWSEPPATPVEALARAGGLTEGAAYERYLGLPLQGTPDRIVSGIGLGPPTGELFALQSRLVDELDDEGRSLLIQLGNLF
jgi:hypothetical protein